MTTYFRSLNAIAVLLLLAGSVAFARADGPQIAMQGYDPVAYFRVAAPTKGSSEFAHIWDGERYLFSSADNRDRFAKEPARYAPQFPRYCAAALTRGEVATPDPQHWVIIDGKLYLFAGAIGPKLFRENPDLAKKAEDNWIRARKAAN